MPTPINISASRGAAILGLSNWTTPLNVWLHIMESREPGFCEKNKYEIPEFEETPAIRWGKAFESAIIELAEGRSDYKITNREKLFKQTLIDYITCHIDGEYFIPNKAGISTLHEGKTTSIFYFQDNFGEPGTDRVPREYQVQCQHQMICTGAEKVILSVLVFPRRVEDWEEMGWGVEEEQGCYCLTGKDKPFTWPLDWAKVLDQQGYFHQYKINAHPDLQKLVIEAYTEWWEKYVIGRTPPEPQDYADIKSICREPVGTIIATEEIESIIAERKDINSEIGSGGSLKQRAEIIRVQALNYMRTAGVTEDDESKEKWILRARNGDKLATYGKNKNGEFYFR